MEPQSKVRKNQNRAGDATLGHGGSAGAGQGRSKSSQGVAGGEKACKRGRLRDQGPRHDATATAMQLSLGKQDKSRDGGLGQDQQATGDTLNEQQTLEDDGESQGSKEAGSEARTKVRAPRSGTDGKYLSCSRR